MSNLYFIGFGPEWEGRQALPGLPGERWAVAVRKADLLGREAEGCALVWLGGTPLNDIGPCDVARCQPAGTLRTPQGLQTIRLRLTLTQNSPISEPHWALYLGGKNVLGTCRIAFEGADQYLAKVASWLRKRRRVVRAEVVGNGVEVVLRRFFGGRDWADRKIAIGMGRPARLNTNNPTLTARHLQTLTVPRQDVYAVGIGADLQPGNVFRVGVRQVTVSASDTADSIREYLAPGGELVVSAGTRVACAAEVGSSVRPNTNAPTITATYQSSGGGFDRYKISVGADVRAGNAFTVNGTVRVATALDTAVSIANLFNNTGGVFQVSAGTPVNVGAAPGTALLPNTNAPTCEARKIATRPARTVSRWAVTVGPDVRAGNVFRVGGVAVTAGSGQTARDVAGLLSLGTMGVVAPQNPFLVETPTDAPPVVRAEAGTPLTGENVVGWQADRERLTLEKTDEPQVLADFVMPCREGIWRLGLVDAATRELLAVGNPVDVSPARVLDSVEVGFADIPGAYGLTHEAGFVHTLRVWGGRSLGVPVTEETQIEDLNGSVRRSQTEVRFQSILTTPQAEDWLHEALAVAMKHRRLWVGLRAAYQAGEYELSERAKGTQTRQGRVKLEWIRDVRRNFSLRPASAGGLLVRLDDAADGQHLAALTITATHGQTRERRVLSETTLLGAGPWWVKLTGPHTMRFSVVEGLSIQQYEPRRGLLLKLWNNAHIEASPPDYCLMPALPEGNFSDDFSNDFS